MLKKFDETATEEFWGDDATGEGVVVNKATGARQVIAGDVMPAPAPTDVEPIPLYPPSSQAGPTPAPTPSPYELQPQAPLEFQPMLKAPGGAAASVAPVAQPGGGPPIAPETGGAGMVTTTGDDGSTLSVADKMVVPGARPNEGIAGVAATGAGAKRTPYIPKSAVERAPAVEPIQSRVERLQGDLDKQREEIERTVAANGEKDKNGLVLLDRLESLAMEHVDPRRAWVSKNGFQKVMLILGDALSEAGSLVAGGGHATSAIRQIIEDDVNAQMADKSGALTIANIARQLYGDEQAARTASVALMWRAADSLLDEITVLSRPQGGGGKPPGGLVTMAAAKITTLRRAKQLAGMHEKLGPASGVSSYLPGSDAAAYEAQRHTFVNDLIFSISGKAATDIERKSWLRAVPGSWTFKSTAKNQFKAIEDYAATALQSLDEAAQNIYGVSLNTLAPEARVQLAQGLGFANSDGYVEPEPELYLDEGGGLIIDSGEPDDDSEIGGDE